MPKKEIEKIKINFYCPKEKNDIIILAKKINEIIEILNKYNLK